MSKNLLNGEATKKIITAPLTSPRLVMTLPTNYGKKPSKVSAVFRPADLSHNNNMTASPGRPLLPIYCKSLEYDSTEETMGAMFEKPATSVAPETGGPPAAAAVATTANTPVALPVDDLAASMSELAVAKPPGLREFRSDFEALLDAATDSYDLARTKDNSPEAF